MDDATAERDAARRDADALTGDLEAHEHVAYSRMLGDEASRDTELQAALDERDELRLRVTALEHEERTLDAELASTLRRAQRAEAERDEARRQTKAEQDAARKVVERLCGAMGTWTGPWDNAVVERLEAVTLARSFMASLAPGEKMSEEQARGLAALVLGALAAAGPVPGVTR